MAVQQDGNRVGLGLVSGPWSGSTRHNDNGMTRLHSASTRNNGLSSSSSKTRSYILYHSFLQYPRSSIFTSRNLSMLSSSSSSTHDNNESFSKDNIDTTTTTAAATTTSLKQIFPNKDMTGTTVKEVMNLSIQWLESCQIPESEESVIQLLAQALDLPWSNGFRMVRECLLFNNSDSTSTSLCNRQLTVEEWKTFQHMLKRRQTHEPIQYILGKWDFLDFTLQIRSPLLCPRPETEELVYMIVNDEIVKSVITTKETQTSSSPWLKRPLRILDVGCGTGAIGLGLAKAIPQSHVVAIDVEPIAVETSMENAVAILGQEMDNDNNDTDRSDGQSSSSLRYQAYLCSADEFNVSLVPSSLFVSGDDDDDHGDDRLFDMVVSNPPYIPRPDMATLTTDVVQYESDAALCGGDDGMDVIRDIVYNLPQWCRKGGYCWMEVDPTHPALMKEWLDNQGETLGVSYVDGYQDMFGKDRFVKLQIL